MSSSSTETERRLREYREKIDAIDEQLQALLAARAEQAQAIARIKHAHAPTQSFYRPEREAQVLEKVAARHAGPLDRDNVLRIFREIMAACLALEQPLAVAYFGPEGSFTEAALRKHFGGAVEAVPLASIKDVFREVTAGTVGFGVVPVENSAEGVVTHTHDLFFAASVRIVGEVVLRIHHQLMALGTDRSAIRRVAAHPQALAQCREWLDLHWPELERVPVANNAEAARRAAADGSLAAIASSEAAARWGLTVIARNIEDTPDNSTRFLVIGQEPVGRSGKDKTSLILSAPNIPGALHALLEPLARREISLARIQSRPAKGALWEYVFFIDILGHEEDSPIRDTLAEFEREGRLLRRLGSYPRAL